MVQTEKAIRRTFEEEMDDRISKIATKGHNNNKKGSEIKISVCGTVL